MIDNPLSYHHYIYQRRVNRFTIVAIALLCLAQALLYFSLGEILITFVVTVLGIGAVLVIGFLIGAMVYGLGVWLSGEE